MWAARVEAGGGGEPGTVLTVADDGICVQTGDGVLVLTRLQRPGGKRLAVADFLRGIASAPALAPGQVLAGAASSSGSD